MYTEHAHTSLWQHEDEPLEENGLNEVLMDKLTAFDKNEEIFMDIYNELPQARNYRGKRMNRTTWLQDSGDYRVHGLKAIARKGSAGNS